MLTTNPTFDIGFLTDVFEETSHIRFDIPAPGEGEEDAHGESDHELVD